MDEQEVILRLREHQSELKAAGVEHLRLFGSVARGDQTSDSDIDLLADFDRRHPLSLFMLSRLQLRLSTILERRVDLSSADWMEEPVRIEAVAEAVLAF